METELKGVIVPIVTPIDRDEQIDEPNFRKVIRYLIAGGIHGIFVGGSAGEGPLHTLPQWQRMMEIACDEVHGKIPLLGGVSDTCTRKVTDKIKTLKTIGFSHFVVTPAFYIATRLADEHLRLFGAAKEAAGDMEMIAYNIPQCVGSSIAPETFAELAKRRWIRYCKESSGNLDYFKQVFDAGTPHGLKTLMGDEVLIPDGMFMGAKGMVPVCANYDPKLFVRIYDAAVAGNKDEFLKLHSVMMQKRATIVLSGACWLSGIKYALSLLGMGTGQPISPLQPVTGKQATNIEDLVRADKGNL